MSPTVLSLTVCFVPLVYGMYQSGHFIYKGQVPFTNRQLPIKEIFVPSHGKNLIYCGLQCVREPKCLAIEMCSRKDRQLCRLWNSTNPSFTENQTDSCRYLQLDYQGDNTDTCSKDSFLHTCKDILNNPNGKMASSGVYSINIDCKPIEVWCDMDTDGGGWTVIQRRQSGLTEFYRSWNEYKVGFGNVSDEYWIVPPSCCAVTVGENSTAKYYLKSVCEKQIQHIGNDALHILTTTRKVTLRVDLELFSGFKGDGTWNSFQVDNEAKKYRLSLSGFNGLSVINNCLHDDNDECFRYSNGSQFSTYDKDNDLSVGNCAVDYHGGWWYWVCTDANLNGRYYKSFTEDITSVSCKQWTDGNYASIKTTRMMIR